MCYNKFYSELNGVIFKFVCQQKYKAISYGRIIK